ncbi:hypothetical protein B7494_g6008 [Chlorociboria aeruginascens]|nr:hypothetical protein B7494_g6008 [Chlorociboria aeruginascens]
MSQAGEVVHGRKIPIQGRPSPSGDYLAQCNTKSQWCKARTILVVIDLNGTLLAHTDDFQDTKLRPGALSLIQDLCTNDLYEVMIWSAAKQKYNETDIKKYFNNFMTDPELVMDHPKHKILAAWNQEQCPHYNPNPNSGTKGTWRYKDLDSLWKDPGIQSCAPKGTSWDQTNTVLVDDDAEKGRMQMHNLINIPTFKYSHEHDKNLDILRQILERLTRQTNISNYLMKQPVKQKFDWSRFQPKAPLGGPALGAPQPEEPEQKRSKLRFPWQKKKTPGSSGSRPPRRFFRRGGQGSQQKSLEQSSPAGLLGGPAQGVEANFKYPHTIFQSKRPEGKRSKPIIPLFNLI